MTRTPEAEAIRTDALTRLCPFCGSEPGQPCRARTNGAKLDWPHARRIDAAKPEPERGQALCCQCGNLRTIGANFHHRSSDPNYAWGSFDDKRGWRATCSLKCEACGQSTRHALLPKPGADDWAELQQRFVLGGEPPSQYWNDNDRARLRAEYFAQFPRNPELSHRYWVTEAKEAWAAGRRDVTALCGAPMTLNRDPDRPPANPDHELIAPDRIDWDTEFEDHDTGLWWVDMDCVDCLAVSNRLRLAARRTLLKEWLAYLLAKPDYVPDNQVETLIAAMEATRPTKDDE
ncbi:hypothetical protein ACNO8X_26115 [Mycobacterium sp. PDNC021]|uniref:zinc finger domain-containing protein n=1 Tax=Mycobacterium sp. PDNC021 TaxID=3391399 RepID=UPI003AAB8975